MRRNAAISVPGFQAFFCSSGTRILLGFALHAIAGKLAREKIDALLTQCGWSTAPSFFGRKRNF
jgi:hypothetical protein